MEETKETLCTQKGEEVYKVQLMEDERIQWLNEQWICDQIDKVPISEYIGKEWENIKNIVNQAAKEVLGTRKKFRRRKGLKIWSDEIEEMIYEKQKKYRTYL